MGTTTKGIPYPDETAANDYPAHMQNLATAVDGLLPSPYPPTALPGLATYEETLVTNATAGAAAALDLTAARNFLLVASATTCAVTFANVPAAAGRRITVTMRLRQSAGGGNSWTFPANFDWGAAGAPTWSSAGLADLVGAISDDNGGHWTLLLVGQGYAF